MKRNPRTHEEWQHAVNTAEALIVLDSARQYGLVTGGPKINVKRCTEILSLGKTRGIRAAPDAIEKFWLCWNRARNRVERRLTMQTETSGGKSAELA
jgi:hypothetical protein